MAWCPQRGDFRVFRLDRMSEVAVRRDSFTEAPDQDLATCLERRH
ncbi:WYL domain-containing protein [Bradyrhizobium sp. 2TAF24]